MYVVRAVFQSLNNGSLYLPLSYEARAQPRDRWYLRYLLLAGAFLPGECQEMRPAFAFWLYLFICSYTPEDKIYPWKREFAYVVLILENRVRSWSCLSEGPGWPQSKWLLYLYPCSVKITGAGKSTSVSTISFESHLSGTLLVEHMLCVAANIYNV